MFRDLSRSAGVVLLSRLSAYQTHFHYFAPLFWPVSEHICAAQLPDHQPTPLLSPSALEPRQHAKPPHAILSDAVWTKLYRPLSGIVHGWVPTTFYPKSSCRNNSTVIVTFIVDIQTVAGRPTDGARAHNSYPIGCPHKLLCPVLRARIEKGDHGLRVWINARREIIAITITALTGKC